MFEDQSLEGLNQTWGQCYQPVAAEVLRMRGLWYWYHIGCLSQLWYFPQLQVHVEHDAKQLVSAAPQELGADSTWTFSLLHLDLSQLVPHLKYWKGQDGVGGRGAWDGVFWSRGGGWWLRAKKSWEEKLALVEDRVFAAEMMGLGESLHFRVDPGLVVGETLYLQKGQSVIRTEVNVVSDYGLWCKGIGEKISSPKLLQTWKI